MHDSDKRLSRFQNADENAFFGVATKPLDLVVRLRAVWSCVQLVLVRSLNA